MGAKVTFLRGVSDRSHHEYYDQERSLNAWDEDQTEEQKTRAIPQRLAWKQGTKAGLTLEGK